MRKPMFGGVADVVGQEVCTAFACSLKIDSATEGAPRTVLGRLHGLAADRKSLGFPPQRLQKSSGPLEFCGLRVPRYPVDVFPTVMVPEQLFGDWFGQ